MKKITYYIIVSALLAVSCKKENSPNSQLYSSERNESVDSGARQGDKTIEDYMLNPNNLEEQNVDQTMLLYAKGLKKVFMEDPRLLTSIINFAKNSPTNSLFLERFIRGDASGNQIFNDEMALLLPPPPPGADYLNVLGQALTYQGSTYQPGAKIMNADKAKLDGGFYIAIGTGVIGVENDVIPAIHVKKNQDVTIELLNELQAT